MVEAFHQTCIVLVETFYMKRALDLMFGTGIDSSMIDFGVLELQSKVGGSVRNDL